MTHVFSPVKGRLIFHQKISDDSAEKELAFVASWLLLGELGSGRNENSQPISLGLYGKRLIGLSPYFPCHSFRDQVKPLYMFHRGVIGIIPCLSVYHADSTCNVDSILISPTTRHATPFSQNRYIIYGAQSSCQSKRINQKGGMSTRTVTESLSGYSSLLYRDWVFSFEVPKQGIETLVIHIWCHFPLWKEQL